MTLHKLQMHKAHVRNCFIVCWRVSTWEDSSKVSGINGLLCAAVSSSRFRTLYEMLLRQKKLSTRKQSFFQAIFFTGAFAPYLKKIPAPLLLFTRSIQTYILQNF